MPRRPAWSSWTSGEVLIAGFDLQRLDDERLASLRAHHIGFVFQSFMLIDIVTALENSPPACCSAAGAKMWPGRDRRYDRDDTYVPAA